MLADPNQSVLFNSGGVDVWPGVTRAASGVESERLLEATLWGEPLLGQTAVRLADGTKVSWRGGRWSVWPEREVAFAERG